MANLSITHACGEVRENRPCRADNALVCARYDARHFFTLVWTPLYKIDWSSMNQEGGNVINAGKGEVCIRPVKVFASTATYIHTS